MFLFITICVLFQNCLEVESKSEKPIASFGHDLLKYWDLDPNYLNLNFGSYGAVPKQVMQKQQDWIKHVEKNPDRWFRLEVYDAVNGVRAQVAKYLGVNAKDLAFVDNASGGMSAIFRSMIVPRLLNTTQVTKILILGWAYPMVKNLVTYLQENFNLVEVVTVDITAPISNSRILAAVSRALDANPEIRFASLSHIVSTPAVILPIKQLSVLLKSKGVIVACDGAHAMGQIALNITDLAVDFYTSNGHKWLYTPKGSAILWVSEQYQNSIYPPTISGLGQGSTQFQRQFSYEGTNDYSPYLSFDEALKFRSLFGDREIIDYMHQLAVNGANILAEAWGTEKLTSDDMIGAMANVMVPTLNKTLALELPMILLNEYNTFVPVFQYGDQFYFRISAQIFNEMKDFDFLAGAVLNIIM